MAVTPPKCPSGEDNASSPSALAWPEVTRRGFLYSAGAAAASLASASGTAIADATQTQEAAAAEGAAPGAVAVALKINGERHDLMLEPRVTLLDALREVLGLTGTKKGCDRGQCGACTVLADGRRINACLALAIMYQGSDITTVEGLAGNATLHPMQAAFLRYDALQCGYCTPGQICSATAAVAEMRAGTASAVTPDVRLAEPAIDAEEIRERMSGNICRCGAYQNIVLAVTAVLKGSS
jgi:xanthine dehydrogenase YagT iron-sulfur-binding subunit